MNDMDGMDQGEEQGVSAGTINVSLGKAAKPGDQVQGTWTGTVKSNNAGQAVVDLVDVQADVNQADEAMEGMVGGEMGGEAV